MKRKTIRIDENTAQGLVDDILQESFYPSSEKVLAIKRFLDKGFMKQVNDDIDSDGYPKKNWTVIMLSSDGVQLRVMSLRELLLMLDDKFNYMIKDDVDRRAFFKQVITDWLNNKINKQGILSVNHI